MRWLQPGPKQEPSPPEGGQGSDEAPVRWLTYRCGKCGGRFYSGYTSTSLERILASPGGEPDLFHADCASETPWREAQLQYDDGTPWTPPADPAST